MCGRKRGRKQAWGSQPRCGESQLRKVGRHSTIRGAACALRRAGIWTDAPTSFQSFQHRLSSTPHGLFLSSFRALAADTGQIQAEFGKCVSGSAKIGRLLPAGAGIPLTHSMPLRVVVHLCSVFIQRLRGACCCLCNRLFCRRLVQW